MLAEGLTCAINGCHMGITAEEVARALQRRRAPIRTRSPPRASGAPARAIAGRALRRRDRRRSTMPQKKGDPLRVDTDEYPRAGHDRREAGGAEAGVQEGRHGHGRQRVGHQRRRRGAGRHHRREGAARSARRRSRGSCRTRRPASIRRSWASGRCRPCARSLERAGLRLDDIDLFELNEAFAAQSLAVVRELGLDPAQGQRQRRRDRARPSDRRQRRARADDAGLRAAGAEAALRRRRAVHRRRHGHRDGGGEFTIMNLKFTKAPPFSIRNCEL